MKKLLLSTAAFAGLALAAAAPAHAGDGVNLELGGYASGYVVYNDQDEATGDSLRKLDFRKDTEIHLTGETTLDNGLTVGAHMELLADRADNGDGIVEESYLYFSGGWGRVNFGEEDGAAYLLQVAAPSADDKVDGLRPDINAFNGLGVFTDTDLGYSQDMTGYANKLTYLTPIFNGFQAGVSFTPAVSEADQNGLDAIGDDDDTGVIDYAYELAARYEASFEGVDIALGAGFGQGELEEDTAATDDRQQWNVGANLGWNGWGFGAAYLTDNNGVDDEGDTTTWVAGIDYTTGPYKIGLSYLDRSDEAASPFNATTDDLDTTRWTGGVTYEYGPGMSFRGAVSYIEHDADDAAVEDVDGYQVTLGTQVNF